MFVLSYVIISSNDKIKCNIKQSNTHYGNPACRLRLYLLFKLFAANKFRLFEKDGHVPSVVGQTFLRLKFS